MGGAKKIFVVFLVALSVRVNAQELGSVLIRNGTVLTITNGTLEETDVLIIDGKIREISKNVSAPNKIKVIDATGMYVMPGIIDTHSHIAVDGINEATNPVTSEVSVADALNPFDIDLYRALAGGVTTIQVLHGSANVIGGQSETIKLRYGTANPEELIMEGAPRTIKFALGENPIWVHGSNHGIVPRTRMGIEFVIRKALKEAQQYQAAWVDYNRLSKTKEFKGMPPEYSLRLETLADVLAGDIIIQCHSYRADEISMMLNVCKDFGIEKIVFQHANEGFKVAPELAANGAMAGVFSDRWAYKFEVYYSTAYNAAILLRNGVVTSLNSDDSEIMRHLYHEAAKTKKYGGLTDDEALALVTINPAKQLGVEDRIGSIEVGKDGDVVIFSAHPLSIYTKPVMTLVDGTVYFNREEDAADMRLLINPDQTYAPVIYDRRDLSEDYEVEE